MPKITLQEAEELDSKVVVFVHDGDVLFVVPQNEVEVEDRVVKGNKTTVMKFLAKLDEEDDEPVYRMVIMGTPTSKQIINAIKQANQTKKPVKVEIKLRQ